MHSEIPLHRKLQLKKVDGICCWSVFFSFVFFLELTKTSHEIVIIIYDYSDYGFLVIIKQDVEWNNNKVVFFKSEFLYIILNVFVYLIVWTFLLYTDGYFLFSFYNWIKFNFFWIASFII